MKTNPFLRSLSDYKVNIILVAIALLLLTSIQVSFGQQDNNQRTSLRSNAKYETFGHTLNLGVGVGYAGYIGYPVPLFMANYEINVANNFTLAPFIGIASYRSRDDFFYSGRRYYYHETYMPIGVKGTYYFDRILNAGPNWDFYLAGSLGFNYYRRVWDDGYNGNRDINGSASPLYIDLHIGTEYHVSRGLGLFLDVSTGISTVGLAIHHL